LFHSPTPNTNQIHVTKKLFRDPSVIEFQSLVANDLVIFVPFSCDDHRITGLSSIERFANCLAAVFDDLIAIFTSKTAPNFFENLGWGFVARIVRSNDANVAVFLCSFGHRNSLSAITAATTTEHCNHPFVRQPTNYTKNIVQGVGCVCVVDKHVKWRAFSGHHFKSTRDLWSLGQIANGLPNIQPSTACRSDRSQSIIDIKSSDQRHPNKKFTTGGS